MLNELHQFPPTAAVLPEIMDLDDMVGVGVADALQHLFAGVDVLPVDLGAQPRVRRTRRVPRTRRVVRADDIEVGFTAARGQGFDNAVVRRETARQPAGDFLFRHVGAGSALRRRRRFPDRGATIGDGREFARRFAHGFVAVRFPHRAMAALQGRRVLAHGLAAALAYGFALFLHGAPPFGAYGAPTAVTPR